MSLPNRIKNFRRYVRTQTAIGRALNTGTETADDADLADSFRYLALENEALWDVCSRLGQHVDLLRGRIGALERRIGR